MDAWLLGAPHAYLDILYLLAVLWVLGQRKHPAVARSPFPDFVRATI